MPDLPPLSRLRPFEAAARTESFSKAAEMLGMTQAAVSKQIAALELDLGLQLFERRNRAVFLTEEGRRLARVVSEALSDIAAEISILKGRRRAGELVLHCQLCEAFFWLMPRLSGFHTAHPDVELRVVSSLNPLTEAQEDFDVAIQTSGRASGSARLAFTVSDEIAPVCAPGYFGSASLPISPAELAKFDLLEHDVTPQDWMDWEGWFAHVGAEVPHKLRRIAMNSYPVALQAAAAGQGIALGWKRTTQAMLDEGKLIRPCNQSVFRPTELSVFRGPMRPAHPETASLLSWLEEELSA